VDTSGSGQRHVEGSYERGNKRLSPMKSWEYHDKLRKLWLFKKDSVQWSELTGFI
jgi:hypothetical protein